jgi:hypothetical protein
VFGVKPVRVTECDVTSVEFDTLEETELGSVP